MVKSLISMWPMFLVAAIVVALLFVIRYIEVEQQDEAERHFDKRMQRWRLQEQLSK